jgi:Xaa-Pro aminopeptidase
VDRQHTADEFATEGRTALSTVTADAELLAKLAAAHVDALRARLTALGHEAFLATSDEGVFYLSGLNTRAYERFLGLLVTLDGPPVIIAPSLDGQSAREQTRGVDIRLWDDGEDALELVAELLLERRLSRARLAVEDTHLSYRRLLSLQAKLPYIALDPGSNELDVLRRRKSAEEIQLMRAAAEVAVRAVNAVFCQVRPGMAELDAQALLLEELSRGGSEEHETIVTGGTHTAIPNGRASGRKLRSGDILLIDTTARVSGYFGDVTRCGVIGEPNADQRERWSVVQRAHAAALGAVAPGARAGTLDSAARAVIRDAGYGDAFLHRVGHGLGLEVHESPYLFGDNDLPLESGMTFTIEPCLSFPGWGGLRLEDDLALNGSEAELLTVYPRDLPALPLS